MANSTKPDNTNEHGVIFMALCASLFRQFEFIQQQWMQYGASFNVGNDTDPIVGLRNAGAKFVIPADPNKRRRALFLREHSAIRGDPRRRIFLLTELDRIARDRRRQRRSDLTGRISARWPFDAVLVREGNRGCR